MCFTSYMEDLKNNSFIHKISDDLRTYYIDCLKQALILIKADKSLKIYVDKVKQNIENLKEESDLCLLDIFYHSLHLNLLRDTCRRVLRKM